MKKPLDVFRQVQFDVGIVHGSDVGPHVVMQTVHVPVLEKLGLTTLQCSSRN